MGRFKLFSTVTSTSSRMGCAGSKEDEDAGGGRKGDKNGGGTSGSTGGASTAAAAGAGADPCDQRIPMTAKQKYSIVASWKGIHRALEPTGVCMFVKLFEEHEELLALFTNFSDMRTREQQEESLELAEHAAMVMNTLDHAIRSLDNPDAFVQFVEKTGASHHRIPGYKKDYFWKIEKPFLEAIKTTLGDRFTDNMESIYKIAIQLIIQTLISGFEKGPAQS